MRTRALFASTAFLALIGTAAFAQDTTVYGHVADRYIFTDFGEVASDEPVFQGGVTRSFGNGCTADLWISVELSGQGSFGSRGGGDEIDVTGECARDFETPFGTVEASASVGYYVSDFGYGFGSAEDDLLAVKTSFGLPIAVTDRLTLTPAVSPQYYRGFGLIDEIVMVSTSGTADYQFSDRWSGSLELGHSENLTDDWGVDWGVASVNFQQTESLSWSLTYKDSDRTPGMVMFGFARTF